MRRWQPVLGALGAMSMAKLQSSVVATKVLASRGLITCSCGCSVSSRAGFFHAERFAVGGDDDGVMEESVEEADGRGVFGQEAAPVLERPV